MVKAVLNEYKELALWPMLHPDRNSNSLAPTSIQDKVKQQLGFSSTTKACKAAITGGASGTYYHEPTESGWYRRQWELLAQIINRQELYSGHVNLLTADHKFKKKSYRLCDIVTAPVNGGKYGLEKTIDSIIESIKTVDDFVEFVDSPAMNIIPLAYHIDNELPTYTAIFQMIGAYYTMQNMIMFHGFTGLDMEKLNDIANNNPDELWDEFLDQIGKNNLMDYLIPTQVDEV